MTVSLSPIGGAASQFFDSGGVPLVGGKLYTYEAGTTAPKATFTEANGLTSHTNPIILDSTGRVPGGEIWLTFGQSYLFVLKTTVDVLLGTYDNIKGINDTAFTNTPVNFTGDGSTTTFVLPVSPLNENWTQVFISGIYQFKNTYSVSGTSLIFSEAPPVNAKIEVEY